MTEVITEPITPPPATPPATPAIEPGPPPAIEPPVLPGTARIVEGAEKLLAEGEPITLLDGQQVRIRYGMRSLLELERRFGGLTAVQQSISNDGSGRMIEPSLQLLSCGLLGEKDSNGAPLTVDRLADLLSPLDLQAAVTQAAYALAQAFPTPAPALDPVTGASLGASGTTQPPSLSVEAQPSSGT